MSSEIQTSVVVEAGSKPVKTQPGSVSSTSQFSGNPLASNQFSGLQSPGLLTTPRLANIHPTFPIGKMNFPKPLSTRHAAGASVSSGAILRGAQVNSPSSIRTNLPLTGTTMAPVPPGRTPIAQGRVVARYEKTSLLADTKQVLKSVPPVLPTIVTPLIMDTAIMKKMQKEDIDRAAGPQPPITVGIGFKRLSPGEKGPRRSKIFQDPGDLDSSLHPICRSSASMISRGDERWVAEEITLEAAADRLNKSALNDLNGSCESANSVASVVSYSPRFLKLDKSPTNNIWPTHRSPSDSVPTGTTTMVPTGSTTVGSSGSNLVSSSASLASQSFSQAMSSRGLGMQSMKVQYGAATSGQIIVYQPSSGSEQLATVREGEYEPKGGFPPVSIGPIATETNFFSDLLSRSVSPKRNYKPSPKSSPVVVSEKASDRASPAQDVVSQVYDVAVRNVHNGVASDSVPKAGSKDPSPRVRSKELLVPEVAVSPPKSARPPAESQQQPVQEEPYLEEIGPITHSESMTELLMAWAKCPDYSKTPNSKAQSAREAEKTAEEMVKTMLETAALSKDEPAEKRVSKEPTGPRAGSQIGTIIGSISTVKEQKVTAGIVNEQGVIAGSVVPAIILQKENGMRGSVLEKVLAEEDQRRSPVEQRGPPANQTATSKEQPQSLGDHYVNPLQKNATTDIFEALRSHRHQNAHLTNSSLTGKKAYQAHTRKPVVERKGPPESERDSAANESTPDENQSAPAGDHPSARHWNDHANPLKQDSATDMFALLRSHRQKKAQLTNRVLVNGTGKSMTGSHTGHRSGQTTGLANVKLVSKTATTVTNSNAPSLPKNDGPSGPFDVTRTSAAKSTSATTTGGGVARSTPTNAAGGAAVAKRPSVTRKSGTPGMQKRAGLSSKTSSHGSPKGQAKKRASQASASTSANASYQEASISEDKAPSPAGKKAARKSSPFGTAVKRDPQLTVNPKARRSEGAARTGGSLKLAKLSSPDTPKPKSPQASAWQASNRVPKAASSTPKSTGSGSTSSLKGSSLTTGKPSPKGGRSPASKASASQSQPMPKKRLGGTDTAEKRGYAKAQLGAFVPASAHTVYPMDEESKPFQKEQQRNILSGGDASVGEHSSSAKDTLGNIMCGPFGTATIRNATIGPAGTTGNATIEPGNTAGTVTVGISTTGSAGKLGETTAFPSSPRLKGVDDPRVSPTRELSREVPVARCDTIEPPTGVNQTKFPSRSNAAGVEAAEESVAAMYGSIARSKISEVQTKVQVHQAHHGKPQSESSKFDIAATPDTTQFAPQPTSVGESYGSASQVNAANTVVASNAVVSSASAVSANAIVTSGAVLASSTAVAPDTAAPSSVAVSKPAETPRVVMSFQIPQKNMFQTPRGHLNLPGSMVAPKLVPLVGLTPSIHVGEVNPKVISMHSTPEVRGFKPAYSTGQPTVGSAGSAFQPAQFVYQPGQRPPASARQYAQAEPDSPNLSEGEGTEGKTASHVLQSATQSVPISVQVPRQISNGSQNGSKSVVYHGSPVVYHAASPLPVFCDYQRKIPGVTQNVQERFHNIQQSLSPRLHTIPTRAPVISGATSIGGITMHSPSICFKPSFASPNFLGRGVSVPPMQYPSAYVAPTGNVRVASATRDVSSSTAVANPIITGSVEAAAVTFTTGSTFVPTKSDSVPNQIRSREPEPPAIVQQVASEVALQNPRQVISAREIPVTDTSLSVTSASSQVSFHELHSHTPAKDRRVLPVSAAEAPASAAEVDVPGSQGERPGTPSSDAEIRAIPSFGSKDVPIIRLVTGDDEDLLVGSKVDLRASPCAIKEPVSKLDPASSMAENLATSVQVNRLLGSKSSDGNDRSSDGKVDPSSSNKRDPASSTAVNPATSMRVDPLMGSKSSGSNVSMGSKADPGYDSVAPAMRIIAPSADAVAISEIDALVDSGIDPLIGSKEISPPVRKQLSEEKIHTTSPVHTQAKTSVSEDTLAKMRDKTPGKRPARGKTPVKAATPKKTRMNRASPAHPKGSYTVQASNIESPRRFSGSFDAKAPLVKGKSPVTQKLNSATPGRKAKSPAGSAKAKSSGEKSPRGAKDGHTSKTGKHSTPRKGHSTPKKNGTPTKHDTPKKQGTPKKHRTPKRDVTPKSGTHAKNVTPSKVGPSSTSRSPPPKVKMAEKEVHHKVASPNTEVRDLHTGDTAASPKGKASGAGTTPEGAAKRSDSRERNGSHAKDPARGLPKRPYFESNSTLPNPSSNPNVVSPKTTRRTQKSSDKPVPGGTVRASAATAKPKSPIPSSKPSSSNGSRSPTEKINLFYQETNALDGGFPQATEAEHNKMPSVGRSADHVNAAASRDLTGTEMLHTESDITCNPVRTDSKKSLGRSVKSRRDSKTGLLKLSDMPPLNPIVLSILSLKKDTAVETKQPSKEFNLPFNEDLVPSSRSSSVAANNGPEEIKTPIQNPGARTLTQDEAQSPNTIQSADKTGHEPSSVFQLHNNNIQDFESVERQPEPQVQPEIPDGLLVQIVKVVLAENPKIFAKYAEGLLRNTGGVALGRFESYLFSIFNAVVNTARNDAYDSHTLEIACAKTAAFAVSRLARAATVAYQSDDSEMDGFREAVQAKADTMLLNFPNFDSVQKFALSLLRFVRHDLSDLDSEEKVRGVPKKSRIIYDHYENFQATSRSAYSVDFSCSEICVHGGGSRAQRRCKRINKNLVVEKPWDQVRAELYALPEVKHPGVLQVLDVFEDYQYYYVVTEALGKAEPLLQNLQTTYNRGMKVTERSIRNIVQQILNCLDYVNRDVCYAKSSDDEAKVMGDSGTLMSLVGFSDGTGVGSGALSCISGIDSVCIRKSQVFIVDYGIEDALGRGQLSQFEHIGRIMFLMFTGSDVISKDTEERYASPDWSLWPTDATTASLSLCRKLIMEPMQQTYDTVLGHSWFRVSSTEEENFDKAMSSRVISKIIDFQLKRNVYNQLLHKLGTEAKEPFLDAATLFLHADPKRTGVISSAALEHVLNVIGVSPETREKAIRICSNKFKYVPGAYTDIEFSANGLLLYRRLQTDLIRIGVESALQALWRVFVDSSEENSIDVVECQHFLKKSTNPFLQGKKIVTDKTRVTIEELFDSLFRFHERTREFY